MLRRNKTKNTVVSGQFSGVRTMSGYAHDIPGTRAKAITVPDIRARKGGEPIVVLTAYTAPIARLLDPEVDIILVGDSLGMVVHGMPNTLGVTVDMMILHGQAVMRGASKALVVIDMPFGSFEESPEVAFRNASRIMQETGCAAVKLEGGVDMAPTIEFLTRRGIPVMGHVGLMPQKMKAEGGFKTVRLDRTDIIMEDARAVTEAGAFSLVIEGVVEPLARKVSDSIAIPTIGIGASAACDGQVLVVDDMIGLFDEMKPKFVKRYGAVADSIRESVAAYAADVRARRFPSDENLFGVEPPKAAASRS